MRRIAHHVAVALRPSRDKWFDINDIKMLGLCALALFSGWGLVSAAILIFG